MTRSSALAALEGATGCCPSCRAERQVPNAVALLALSGVGVVWGLVIAAGGGPADLARLAFATGAVTPLLFAQVAPHEAGHAIAARLLRIRVPEVVIGIGPTLASPSAGSTTVTVRAVPASGLTVLACTSTSGYRLRRWLAVAAGPAVSLAIILVFSIWAPSSGPAGFLRTLVIGTAAWTLIANLVPRTLGANGHHTDGWHLVTIPSLSASAVQAKVAIESAIVAILDARHRRDRPELAAEQRAQLDLACEGDRRARLIRLQLRVLDRDWERAADAAEELLDQADVSDLNRPVLLNIVAWCRLMSGAVHSGDEADTCSAEARWLMPASAGIAGTRGSVLVELGAPGPGLELLRWSLDHAEHGSDRASTACYLAIGAADSGRRDEAEAALATAARLDPDCYLLDRARARVDRARSPGDPNLGT